MDRETLIEAALEDARERNNAVVELLRFTDQQAMTLLGFFATVGVASISGAAASLSLEKPFSNYAIAALVGAFTACMLGSLCAFKAQGRAEIALPGREAAFWEWALALGAEQAEQAITAYLKALNESAVKNDAVNERGTYWLDLSRKCAIAAPVAALLAAGAMFAVTSVAYRCSV